MFLMKKIDLIPKYEFFYCYTINYLININKFTNVCYIFKKIS